MKKLLLLLVLFISVSVIIFYNYKNKETDILVSKEENIKDIEDRAVFVSYIDYSNLFKNKNEETIKSNIEEIVNNVSKAKFNMIILQVRPFSDAIYNSEIFLSSKTVVEKEGDPLVLDILEYFVFLAHQKDIKLYAWINPYRIRSTSSIEDLSKDAFYYKWLDTNKVEISAEGIYLNPADSEVKEMIIKGVEEIVVNYDVDGILYDDYFYPSKTVDNKNYEDYQSEGGMLTLEEYRRVNINTLIHETYESIKRIDEKVMFGISPAGNINNNYNEEFLDVNYILTNKNHVDFIMPQLYYGFNNENMPYIDVLTEWSNLVKESNISLYPALSLYKSGNEDKYALSGNKEWIENNDIIKKQIIISRLTNNYKGFAIYRYNNLFPNENVHENVIKEIENIKETF